MMEQMAMRFVGGPLNGTKTIYADFPPGDTLMGFQGGHYKKTNQSIISDEDIKTMTHVMRGAEYEWHNK